MATAKKTSTASKIRNALTKYPDSKVSAVARMFNVSPAYVYQVKSKMDNPTPKTPKQQWKIVHMSTSKEAIKEKLKAMPLTSARKAEIERQIDADQAYEMTKGRDRVEMIEPQADNVNHPAHYKVGGIETIDFIEAKNLNYRLGNVVKYITRADSKGNRKEDLLKAQWYLNREIAAMSN